MEGINTFLETSTIHGLTYISTTRKYARLFWIIVVVTGFVGASLLIKESFDSWSESPIKTTVETLPIAEIRLPKVTVCPPKSSYTDLNYDLMMTENITLTGEVRDELFKYAVEVINEDSYSENNWTKLHEEDKFYNWYHGYNHIGSPYYDDFNGLSAYINTAAISGVVTTQHYGEQYRPELVERKLVYFVHLYPPLSVGDNTNVTLHLKLEKVPMTGLARGSVDIVTIDNLEDEQTTVYRNITPPLYETVPSGSFVAPVANFRIMLLWRDVSSEDVESQKLDLMPGFRFSWWYSGEVTPDNRFKDDKMNKQFVR